jgi:KaiC/GvpD/RAD55 family RecA-like ATPase
MREKQVLASSMSDREAYDRIADHIERDDFTEQGFVIWSGITDFYEADGAACSVESGILAESIARIIPADKHKDMFRNLVGALSEMDVSTPNVVADLLATKRDVVGRQLAAALLEGESAGELHDRYGGLLLAEDLGEAEEAEERVGLSVATLVEERFDPANLIKIMPESLNKRLGGGVKPGHHLILFARPEMGKTMMTIEMMAGFARQGLPCLYVGNEDPIDDINMRIVNRLSNMTKEEVMKDPDKADVEARKNGYENIIMAPLAPGTPREITKLIEKHQPAVLVLDQLRNLNMSQDNYVLALENAAKFARQCAKRYSCVVVSVTQAGDSAARKAVLDMGDVDYSNTGIPAQADVMIGLGANDVHAKNGEIVISLPKNKVSGVHEYFACGIQPHLSKIVSIA